MTTEYALKLASLTKLCSRSASVRKRLFAQGASDIPHTEDCICHGTGRVYLLRDAVRVKCLCDHPDRFHNDDQSRCSCCKAQSHNWTPTTDNDVLSQEVQPILEALEYDGPWEKGIQMWVDGRLEGKPDLALEGAWQALVAAGYAKETP